MKRNKGIDVMSCRAGAAAGTVTAVKIAGKNVPPTGYADDGGRGGICFFGKKKHGKRIACYTGLGGRENNEDSVVFAVSKHSLLLGVADGVGGAGSGEIASALMVDELAESFKDYPTELKLLPALKRGNYTVYKRQQEMSNDMKTTAAVVFSDGSSIFCAHSGDSRIYLFGSGNDGGENKIIYQSPDHSAAYLAVITGEITTDGLRGHCDRNRILRCVGVPPKSFKADEKSFDLAENGITAILLCSDGFWEYVTEDEMLSALSKSRTPDKWLRKMREIAKQRMDEGCDNNMNILSAVHEAILDKFGGLINVDSGMLSSPWAYAAFLAVFFVLCWFIFNYTKVGRKNIFNRGKSSGGCRHSFSKASPT